MDNKQAISWLKLAVPVRALTREEFEKFIIAVNMAMNSLEAWDKVKKEMKYFYNVYDSYDEEELTKEELWTVSLGKRHYKHALYIINKHLKESD